MIIRAIMVPNCGNGSICPSPTTTNLSFAGSTGHRRLASMAALRPRLPERPSASRLASRPPAAAGYVGTIGELSATTESFYELLGIPVSGSHDDIKRAYKQLARKYHPDVSPPDRTEEYTQRFILVQEAYETLSDPECRALYDRYLARGLHYALSARRRFGEILYRIPSPMSSVNSSVRQDTRQHSEVYCHCHLKCVVYTCYRGPNRGRQFYRCIHNRTGDDCNFFKWIDELEEPSFDTHYALRGIDEMVLKKLDLLIFQMKVFIVLVAIDIIIRIYFV